MTAPRSPHHFSALAAALLVSACVQGPDYKAPRTQVASAWVGQANAGAVAEGSWWKDLGDPLLDALVDEMLAGNPSLKEAQARLAEARANRDAVRGGRLPQASVSATGNQVELSKNGQIPVGQIPGFSRNFALFDLGFDASWELDIWGRQLRQDQAAEARTQSAALSVEGARLQLVAELARAYVDLRLAQSDRDTAVAMLDARGRLAALTDLRAARGEANVIDASRAGSDVEAARVALASAEAGVRGAALRVATLVGAAPADIVTRLEAPGAIPTAPDAIAAGLPSDLLRRRPDILGAERDLAAASADIGVAKADLFPRLSLSFALGQQARAIGDLADGASTRLQAGGGLMWPIFNGGRARAIVRAADARAQGAAARYDAAVIAALADSEGAINRFDRSLAALAAARAALAREDTALGLARQRVAAGEDDKLALARADLAHLAAAQQLAHAQAGASEAAIAVHKALGGGWSPDSLAAAEAEQGEVAPR
ncbi:efflux transporter outer membrane subunit [Sphingobium nicotianae]|uniref:Efflux transporter outer membrane subunit n=1 Tax=Sphingobium nicotianae TaxID=2782607 RepID=A0A9X1IQ86_9SPHN|nr:efflux transporter outer membrane subunit [Sphingobium nicotianae]MBT2186494.1 efflux transporter outer membrane subunit [Sphingobium nicotianae]